MHTTTLAASPVIAARRATRRRALAGGAGAAGLAVVVAIVALGIGPVPLAPDAVAGILAHHLLGAPGPSGLPPLADEIVWGTRAPRVAMGLVAGAALAVAGGVLQAAARNALADPYLLGLNSGASTGVAVVVLVAGGATGLALSGAALVGAVGATALVLGIAGAASTRGPHRLVLAGLAVGYALSAATSFLLFWTDSPEAARSVLFWLLGSIASVQPLVLLVAAVVAALVMAGFVVNGPRLDAIASGDDSAIAAGMSPEGARFAVMAVASATVGVVVAGVGGVGFVGLVVPHLARALAGGRHRAMLPAAAGLGAALLVAADTVARTAFAPQEIPVGVVTGAVGAPVLLLLLRRSGRPAHHQTPHERTP